ncbi:MAG TPA: hypothetical protein VFS68_11600 [Candidatus Udaeobacter sp.]|jgi:hypothetical protein|nr:hypothetical protein [Candidatus Udaeobacter sp.]
MNTEENNQLETRLDAASREDAFNALSKNVENIAIALRALQEEMRALKARLFHPSEN